jgi:hypothetical protein
MRIENEKNAITLRMDSQTRGEYLTSQATGFSTGVRRQICSSFRVRIFRHMP